MMWHTITQISGLKYPSHFIIAHYVFLQYCLGNTVTRNGPKIVECASILLTPFIVSASLVILAIFGAYKFLAWCMLKLSLGDDFKGLSAGLEVMVEFFTTEYPLTVNVAVFVESEESLEVIHEKNRRKIASLLESETSNTKLFCTKERFMGYEYMEKANGLHVNEIYKKFYCKISEDNLMDSLEKCFKLRLPRNNKFIWDTYLYTTPLIRSGKKVWIIVYRIHHAIADGFTIYNILSTLMCQRSTLKSPYATKIAQGFKGTSNVTKSRIRMEKLPPFLSKDDNHLMAGTQTEDASVTCFMENDEGYMKKVKEIKNKFGVSFTCVVLAAYSAAISEYFLKNSDDPPEEVTVSMPIQKGTDRLYKFMTHDFRKELTNDFIMVALKLPIVPKKKTTEMIRSYLMERIEMVRKELETLSKSYEAQFINIQSMTYLSVLPVGLLKLVWSGIRVTCGTSLFPGGPKLKFHNGGDIKQILFFLPKSPSSGLFMCVYTYDDKFQVSLVAGKDKFPDRIELDQILADIFRYVDLIHEEFVK